MEVTFVFLVLLVSLIRCSDVRYQIERIDGVGEAKENAIKWLKSQRDANCGWEDTARAVTALMLVQEEFETYERELYMKELDLAITVGMRNPILLVDTIALYINALISTCRDPRNFYGIDLIKALKENQRYHLSVMALMALCNADETNVDALVNMINRIIRNINAKLLSNDPNPRLLDQKALASIALGCCLKNGSSGYVFDETDGFRDKVFGSVYRTALTVQADLASGKTDDLETAIEFLVSRQLEDGSFGNVMTTYLVLPVLSGKTLSNLSDISCRKDSCEELMLPVQTYKADARLRELKYELWFGEDKHITRSITIAILYDQTKSIFDVMKLAASTDHSFGYKYVENNGRKEVYSIGGQSNDPELSYYWQFHIVIKDQLRAFNYTYDLPNECSHVVWWYKLSR